MEYSIQMEHVTKQYDKFCLDDVSFQVEQGTIMGLIGENGAGKTTLIKLLLNLIHKDNGKITLFGEKTESAVDIKERIGVVMDQCFFYDTLRAVDVNQIMKNIMKNWQENKFNMLLDKLSIDKQKKIKAYSQGMKRKLSLAVALAHNPQLLILDEPMNGLDPVVRNEMLDLFLEFIMDETKTILLSSHITSDLEKIADYITFLHQGKIVFGESKDVLLEDYGIIKCEKNRLEQFAPEEILGYQRTNFDLRILIKNREQMERKYSDCMIDRVNLEEIMLLYGREG